MYTYIYIYIYVRSVDTGHGTTRHGAARHGLAQCHITCTYESTRCSVARHACMTPSVTKSGLTPEGTKRATSASAEGPAYGLDFTRH